MISALLPQSSVFSTLSCPKLPFRHQRSKDPKLISRLIPRKLLVRGPFRSPSVIKCNVSGRSGQGFRLKDVKEFHPEPFWLSLSKEAFGVLRSLIVFLIEQPSQLRYIEWPSFQSTPLDVFGVKTCGQKKSRKASMSNQQGTVPCAWTPVFSSEICGNFQLGFHYAVVLIPSHKMWWEMVMKQLLEISSLVQHCS